jgi:hypothetical protein
MDPKTPLLTDEQWAAVAPLLPAEPTDAQPTNREFIEGVWTAWLSGGIWPAWPQELGDYKTAYVRAVEWQEQDIWANIAALVIPAEAKEQIVVPKGLKLVDVLREYIDATLHEHIPPTTRSYGSSVAKGHFDPQ